MKSHTSIKNFGTKLSELRKLKSLTQSELADKVNVSRRVILYYERESNYPPTHLLIPLSKALKVTIDELLGLKNTKLFDSTKNSSLWKKLKKVEILPKKDQKAVLHYIEALVNKNN